MVNSATDGKCATAAPACSDSEAAMGCPQEHARLGDAQEGSHDPTRTGGVFLPLRAPYTVSNHQSKCSHSPNTVSYL